MHLRIRIDKGPNKGDAFEMTMNSQPIVIGRSEKADFIIPSSLVSKQHCRIYVDTKSRIVWLKDLNSTNGTFLNGERVDEVVIHPGDKIQMGEILLSVEDASVVKYTSDLSGKILGGYRIDEKIGRGSMGTVYRANQLSLGREVALKVLEYNLSKDINFVKSFLNEARAAGKLNHPNIVTIIERGNVGNVYFFAMEFVDGPSLTQLMREPLDVEQFLHVVKGAAAALHYAHARGVVHRDIKPENMTAINEAIRDLGRSPTPAVGRT